MGYGHETTCRSTYLFLAVSSKRYLVSFSSFCLNLFKFGEINGVKINCRVDEGKNSRHENKFATAVTYIPRPYLGTQHLRYIMIVVFQDQLFYIISIVMGQL